MKRSRHLMKAVRRRILILCEGQTEKNYFQAIKEDPEFKQQLSAVHPQVMVAKNPSPDLLVKQAIDIARKAKAEGNSYDKIWVVFDHDNHPHRANAYKSAEKEGFGIAFSSIAFETWYLLHFKQVGKPFQNADHLTKEYSLHYPTYQKAKQNDFSFLKDRLPEAMTNAKWLRSQLTEPVKHVTDCNPWTDVDILVEELIGEMNIFTA